MEECATSTPAAGKKLMPPVYKAIVSLLCKREDNFSECMGCAFKSLHEYTRI